MSDPSGRKLYPPVFQHDLASLFVFYMQAGLELIPQALFNFVMFLWSSHTLPRDTLEQSEMKEGSTLNIWKKNPQAGSANLK